MTRDRTADSYLETVAEFDVRHLLPKVRTPTLVMQVRHDLRVPIGLGRELAEGIPNARFVALPGKNHVVLAQDPRCRTISDGAGVQASACGTIETCQMTSRTSANRKRPEVAG
ncbi:MAG TPA: alpha/beta fold hydrolase [Bradyrhizobium sp.]|nr:alpha/beta fold hydrolase [Bradyrhizobium sp.]